MTSDLIAKLEALDGPDREVDADIYIAFNIPMERAGRIDRLGGCVGWWPKDAPYESAVDVPRYTASLDAAIALVERVLPGNHLRIDIGDDGLHAANIFGDWGDSHANASSSPAIALLIALLRAKEARDAEC